MIDMLFHLRVYALSEYGMTRISHMLLFSSHDVAFIAQEVGYCDCSYFIRCYKKIKGVTPRQARRAGK